MYNYEQMKWGGGKEHYVMRCAKSIVFYFEEPMNISKSTNFRFIKVFTFLKFTIKISMENTF